MTTSFFVEIENQENFFLMQLAYQKQRSAQFLITQAVREYIGREQARFDFFETGKKAIADYHQTGLHVTHEELQLWAENVDNFVELPVCHK